MAISPLNQFNLNWLQGLKHLKKGTDSIMVHSVLGLQHSFPLPKYCYNLWSQPFKTSDWKPQQQPLVQLS